MAPRARLELATLRLTAECSTVELPGNSRHLIYISSQIDATVAMSVALSDPKILGQEISGTILSGVVNDGTARQ
jgi:hypothetical protein